MPRVVEEDKRAAHGALSEAQQMVKTAKGDTWFSKVRSPLWTQGFEMHIKQYCRYWQTKQTLFKDPLLLKTPCFRYLHPLNCLTRTILICIGPRFVLRKVIPQTLLEGEMSVQRNFTVHTAGRVLGFIFGHCPLSTLKLTLLFFISHVAKGDYVPTHPDTHSMQGCDIGSCTNLLLW